MVTTVVPAAAAPPGRASAPGGVHDAFISYSRRDRLFAAKLEAALERYLPPRDLGVARRRLDIFRDEEDFTGAEYHASLEQHLRNSATLIVICSPHARASKYVNDEIRRFVLLKGAENIIPILLSGVPNNEAAADSSDLAFPDALCEALEMPLAANFAGIDPARQRIDKGQFQGSWHTCWPSCTARRAASWSSVSVSAGHARCAPGPRSRQSSWPH
jgi:hypothetical protein